MAGISELGDGIGYLYATDPITTTDIKYSFPNTEAGARSLKLLGVQSSNIASNLQAFGSFTIDTPTGSGNITLIAVNGHKQINRNISFTIASTPTEIAEDCVAEINSTTPSSGVDYVAVNIGAIVYLLAPASAGDTVNGHAVTVSISGNLTVSSVVDIQGGTNTNDNSYDGRSGYRFFIDNDPNATFGAFTGNQTEITNFICQRGMETGIPVIVATISSGAITIERKAAIQYVVVRGEGGLADTLTTINPVNFANGDQIIILGYDAGAVITIDNTGNIVTQGGNSFATANYANAITLGRSGTSWYEVNKSTTAVPSASDFRTANFPFLSTSGYGSAALTAADNTTVTLTANSSKQKQVITGTATLSTGNYRVELSTSGAKAGDEFIIEYNGVVTVGSYDVIIGGITLSDADALTGGILVKAYYSGSAWQYECLKDYNQGAKVQTADIASSAVTVAKVETNLTYEVLTFNVSWTNPSTHRIEMPYPGTVSKVTAYVTSAITGTATLTPRNNAGTAMTSGTITFYSTDAVDTGRSSSPSGNNTFVAGDILFFETDVTTAGGGTAIVSVKITRS